MFACFEFLFFARFTYFAVNNGSPPPLFTSDTPAMPTATKKRRMVVYDQNGRMKKDAPEASSTIAKKPKVEEDSKTIGETREARLAKVSQVAKSSFEKDLEKIVQDVKGLRGGV